MRAPRCIWPLPGWEKESGSWLYQFCMVYTHRMAYISNGVTQDIWVRVRLESLSTNIVGRARTIVINEEYPPYLLKRKIQAL